MSDARTRGEQIRLMQLMQERLVRESRSDLLRFTFSTMPNFRPADFHRRYYKVLTDFADGEIKKLMVFMPPQHGKALQVDTPVLTTDGWKRHGDLRVGDFVFGMDGKPKKVQWNSGQYLCESQRVEFADGFSIIAARQHEWMISDCCHTRVIETQQIDGIINPYIPAASGVDNPRRFYIRGVYDVEDCMVNCIQVEGGMYLAGHELVPTHNSEGSTRRLPTFLAGRNPDAKIAVISYSATKAKKFNREMQRIIDSPEYHEIFPDTTLAQSVFGEDNGSGYVRTTEEFEFVGHSGSIKTVGVGGSLTGDPVDYLIMDDIYKDAKTAWSPVVRESVSDWYDTVAETRLHNGSQQLIVFTRWHEEDLAGRLLKEQGTYDPVTNPNGWVVVVFKAIKEGAPTGYDPREEGAALWPEKHSLEKLLATRKRNPHVFESLYQQNPKPAEGLMYDSGFAEYEVRPASMRVKRKAYVDTADTGSDYLCAIIYDETETANYIVDVLYTQKPMEYTEPELARMLTKHQVATCIVESNNGGRGFQRAVEKQCRLMGNVKTKFTWFTQTANKNVRIFSNSAAVQNLCIMPKGWRLFFPDFYNALSGYLKVGSNEHDDAPDALTGTVEKRQSSGGCDVGSLFGY